jgi:hypothetical protein
MDFHVAVEDSLAAQFGLSRDEIAVYGGYSRQTKQIKLPMVGESAVAAGEVFGPQQPRTFRTAVFAPGGSDLRTDEVLDLLRDLVANLGAGLEATKTFF